MFFILQKVFFEAFSFMLLKNQHQFLSIKEIFFKVIDVSSFNQRDLKYQQISININKCEVLNGF